MLFVSDQKEFRARRYRTFEVSDNCICKKIRVTHDSLSFSVPNRSIAGTARVCDSMSLLQHRRSECYPQHHRPIHSQCCQDIISIQSSEAVKYINTHPIPPTRPNSSWIIKSWNPSHSSTGTSPIIGYFPFQLGRMDAPDAMGISSPSSAACL